MLLNTPEPIPGGVVGRRVMFVNLLQLEKAVLPIIVIPLPIITLLKLIQEKKADKPMFVILLLIVIFVKL